MADWLRCGKRNVQRLQLDAVDGGRFAGDAVVIHGVDAVGGDVHFVEGAVAGAERIDAFDGDAAQGEVLGELGVGRGESREMSAEPLGKYFHANCPRNRISPA